MLELRPDYIKTVLQKEGVPWEFDHSVQASHWDLLCITHHYKLSPNSSQVTESSDSNENPSDGGFEDHIGLSTAKSNPCGVLQ
jgi:hypothetical protein